MKIKKLKFNIILVFILFFSILLVNTACAEDVEINQTIDENSFDSIQNIIDNAESGDSIYLENKTYTSNGSAVKINKDITIYGSSSKATILDADYKSNIFVISKNVNVKVYGLTFINGKTVSDGGAISNNGKLTIVDSKFINNEVTDLASGGAIRGSTGSKLDIHNSVFDGNTATFGAAIDSYFSDSQIINCTFINNVGHEGGAIYNRFSDVYLINSTFINNSATRGGGIYNNRGYLVINGSKFHSNSASHLGGGVKSWGVCEIYNSDIRNNTGEFGGGAYISEYLMAVRNCIFDNNNAVEGGGIIADSDGHLDIKNSTVTNNFAEIGGGIDCSWGYLTLEDCLIKNNSASDNGGGLACIVFQSDVKNTIISDNSAKNGGGLYIGKKITAIRCSTQGRSCRGRRSSRDRTILRHWRFPMRPAKREAPRAGRGASRRSRPSSQAGRCRASPRSGRACRTSRSSRLRLEDTIRRHRGRRSGISRSTPSRGLPRREDRR